VRRRVEPTVARLSPQIIRGTGARRVEDLGMVTEAARAARGLGSLQEL